MDKRRKQAMRFLDVRTDYAFKKVFGSEESKEILLSFLNAVIVFADEAKITDLTIVDPYQIPLIKGMKDTYVDVKALLSNGRRVIVEMQVLNVEGFEKRVLYNAAKAYSAQLHRAEPFSGLEPIIAVTVTDFEMFSDIEQVITCFRLIEKETLIEYSDDIELIFIELPKFVKTEDELKTVTDKWIYFIKHAGSLAYVPETLNQEPIDRAFQIANTAGLSEEELEVQHRRRDFIWLQKGSLDKARKDGLKEGIAEGIAQGVAQGVAQGIQQGIQQGIAQGVARGVAQGRIEGKVEIVRSMKKRNMDISMIAELTGLTAEEVRTIAE